MKQGIIFFSVVAVIFALAGCYEISLWHECMADHHWWYCLRLLT